MTITHFPSASAFYQQRPNKTCDPIAHMCVLWLLPVSKTNPNNIQYIWFFNIPYAKLQNLKHRNVNKATIEARINQFLARESSKSQSTTIIPIIYYCVLLTNPTLPYHSPNTTPILIRKILGVSGQRSTILHSQWVLLAPWRVRELNSTSSVHLTTQVPI